MLEERPPNVTNTEQLDVRMKVVGIGGAGGNAVLRMQQAGIRGVEYLAINTDVQALGRIRGLPTFAIGPGTTGGMGSGGNADVGRKAMRESQEQVAQLLEGSDMVFLTAGMGGGTGTGAASDVGLTADIIPAISFTVDPSSIDFGELGPRDTSDPHTITMTNTGAWALLITCTVTDNASDLYVNGLKLDDEMWDLFNATIARDNYQETDATLTVPENYTGVGEQGGTIIFWASEAP